MSTLNLTKGENTYINELCYRLIREHGIPLEYGSFKLAIANWWLGNAGQKYQTTTTNLLSFLTRVSKHGKPA